jgi:cation:H+ antiporter
MGTMGYMSPLTALALVAGFGLLVGGAEFLIKGAATIATRFGVSAVTVGLTVVAFGTSAPELAVTLNSARSGSDQLGLGNVVGSNIANVLLVLGVGAAIATLAVAQRLLRRDIPIMVGASVAVAALAADGQVSRFDGALLAGALMAYIAWTVRVAQRERVETAQVEEAEVEAREAEAVAAEYEAGIAEIEGAAAQRSIGALVAFVAVGLVALVVGSQLLVAAASDIAVAFGVSELVVGLTVVAIGTSLPELATTALAVMRGERDIAVGNVVGSNVFNLLAVLGLSALLSGGVSVTAAARGFDLPVMCAAAVVMLPLCWRGFAITRGEGVALVMFYGAYVAYLISDAAGHASAQVLAPAILIAGGLGAVTLTALAVQSHRGRVARPAP